MSQDLGVQPQECAGEPTLSKSPSPWASVSSLEKSGRRKRRCFVHGVLASTGQTHILIIKATKIQKQRILSDVSHPSLPTPMALAIQEFIRHLLCAKHCSGSWGVSREHDVEMPSLWNLHLSGGDTTKKIKN